MMDYLTRLVARHLELLEVIQPRLMSRFEPSGPKSGSLSDASAWRAEAAAAEPASAAAATAQVSATSPALPSAGFQDQASHRRPVQVQGQQPWQGAAPQLVDAGDENAMQVGQDLAQAQGEQPPEEPLPPGDPRLAGTITLPDFSPEQAGVRLAAPENSTRRTSPGSGQQKHRTASEQPIQPDLAERTSPAGGGSGPEAPFLSPRRLARPMEVAPQTPVTPQVQAAPAPPVEPARMPQAAPVIRVSIGRVEVRAVMAPQAPPPPRPQVRSGPSLSLEDYLQEREGGKR